MSELAIFKFEDALPVRITDRDGSPWFVAKDICRVLEIQNSQRAVAEQLDEDEVRKTYITDSIGRKQETYVISESGMYALVIRSNKPAAKAFRKWITSEVLPNLRRDGSYTLPEQTPEAAKAAPAPVRKVETGKPETPSLFPEQKIATPEETRLFFGLWMLWHGIRVVDTISITDACGITSGAINSMFYRNREKFTIGEDCIEPGTIRYHDLTVADTGYAPRITARAAWRSRWYTLSGLIKIMDLGRGVWHLNEPKPTSTQNRRALPPPKPELNLPARVEKRSGEAVEREVCAILATVNRKLSGGGSLDPAVLDFAGKLAAMAYRK